MRQNDRALNRVDQVAAWHLCIGCGACKWACPHGVVDLVNIPELGIRPTVNQDGCQACRRCVEVCPGVHLKHDQPPEDYVETLWPEWGPIRQMYRAYAAEEDIRFVTSSGGIATALALYGVERAGMDGVLHIRSAPENPLICIATFSRTREEVVQAIGSRYAPAALCQAFDLIKQARGPCMFIGKPCDVAALRKAQKIDVELDAKVGLTISIFCAGTPSQDGTQAILRGMGIQNTCQVQSFRYRGHGWPGEATAVLSSGEQRTMSYEDSWGNILSKHVSWRCRLCPDGTGEFADISCGDMWAERGDDSQGLSLVLIRNECGNRFWDAEKMEEYIRAHKCESDWLARSQPSLLNKKYQIWGRIKAMSLLGCPVPAYQGFAIRRLWMTELSLKKKIKSVLGTIKRIVSRRLDKPYI